MSSISPYNLNDIFAQIELDLISNMQKTLMKHQIDEAKEGFKWEQWQSAKLRNIEKFKNDNKNIIRNYSNKIKNNIEQTLNDNYVGGQLKVENDINKIKKLSIELPSSIRNLLNETPESSFFGINDKKLKSLINATTNDLKNGQTAMLRMADDVYRQTIFKSHVYLQSGSTTLNKAIDMATKDFLDKGFNCITYKNGNRVNIASYAEMALRTAGQRATLMGEGTKRDEWGIHLVAVTAHSNTCELCLPWQGKILIDDVYSGGSKDDGDYSTLSEAMAEGFMHPNCRHTITTYFEGITQLPKPVDNEKALDNYEAEQNQRNMERQIRKYKRIASGSCDFNNINNANAKVKDWQGKLRQHMKDNPQLRRDYNKEKI